ncbi:MAG: hypothetical protein ACRCUT_13425, partial [Spirochaetota bacterium]
ILKWAYFVPSTGYNVYFTSQELNGDSLLVEWTNDDGSGNTRKGQESLRRILSSGTDTISVVQNDTASENRFGGKAVGKIYKINDSEIIVATRAAEKKFESGDILYLIIDGAKVELEVFFSMQTIIKCRLTQKDSGMIMQIEKDMTVYR